MKLFAIGDLHMPGGDDKPMDVFGDHWETHGARIFANWRERVGEADAVLIPGTSPGRCSCRPRGLICAPLANCRGGS